MEELYYPLLAISVRPTLISLITLVAGILILVKPKLLSTIVGVYLIIAGVLGMVHGL